MNKTLYVLKNLKGRLLSLDPGKDEFYTVRRYSDLKIWDIQPYNEENLWFMGNNPRPRSGYMIKPVPRRQLAKLRYF